MRTPQQTEKLLSLLRQLMLTHPEQRLGQLIYNATWNKDIFYITDKLLEQRLKNWKKNP